jgi:hypothetical protein
MNLVLCRYILCSTIFFVKELRCLHACRFRIKKIIVSGAGALLLSYLLCSFTDGVRALPFMGVGVKIWYSSKRSIASPQRSVSSDPIYKKRSIASPQRSVSSDPIYKKRSIASPKKERQLRPHL